MNQMLRSIFNIVVVVNKPVFKTIIKRHKEKKSYMV